MKTVILLEHEGQVKDCLKSLKETKGQKLIIALSPFAMYELDKQNLPYKTPEDYYTPTEFFRIGKAIHKRAEKLCDFIDELLQQEFPELKAAGLCPAKYQIIPLIMVFDALTSRVFQLKRILDRERPDIVFAFCSDPHPYDAYGFCFDNRELLYGKILGLLGWGVKTVVMQTPTKKNSKDGKKIYTFEKKIYELLASNPNTFYAADALRDRRLMKAVSLFGKSLLARNKTNALTLDLSYDVRYCYATFLDKGIFLSYLKDESYAWAHGKKLDSEVVSRIVTRLDQEDVKKYFVHEGIDLYPLLRDRIEFLIRQGVPACLTGHEKAGDVIKSRKIKAVLAPYFVTPTSRSIARAAQNLGVPVLTWFHGVPLNDHATIQYMELMSSDICMSYGTMLSKSYLRHAKQWNAKVVPVGSARLDHTKKVAKMPENTTPKSNNSTRLLYATTHYYQNDFYFCVFPPPSDNMLYRTQLAMINGIGRLDNVNATVKLFPGHHNRDPPLREYAETKGYKNMKWVKDVPPFVDLLNRCDVVVLDFPSTPLVEAVAAGKPVFLLTKYLEIWRDVLKLLKRRVACFEHEGELIKSLKNYLQTGFYTADLSDDGFLKACCTYLNDGKSCERAVTEILKAISRSHLKGV